MRTNKYLSLALPFILFAALTALYIVNASSETSKGTNVSEKTEAAAGNEVLRTVPFITLRNKKTGSDKAADYFGGERSTQQAGYCELSRTAINSLKSIAEITPFYIPEEIIKLEAIRESSIENFWQAMEGSSSGQSPVLYMHGFYISHERGCKRASLLQQSLGLQGRFLLFSWPSAGTILDYTQDEADLYWSVAPLRGVLDDMVGRFGTGNASIVAHSLGTRGVMLALVLLAQTQQDNRPLFNQVVLIAPDIDVGIFEQYLSLIRPLASNMTVYVSGNDSPLALSRQVHGHPRLGEAGEHLAGINGIEIIDVSDIPIRVPSGHVYHLYQDSVAGDMAQLINENKPAAQRRNLKQVGKNLWRLQKTETE